MTSSIEKSLLRQSLRNHIRQQRRALSQREQSNAAYRLMKRIMHDARIHSASTIAVFLSFDGEIDTSPLITALWESGKQVYLPALHPFSEKSLIFMHYKNTTPLVLNRLRIREPQMDITTSLPIVNLNIIFTPLVAFDTQGQRLGMGGGFYDQALKNWKTQASFYPIGLAHDCQQLVNPLPVEEWDIPLPEIITPSHHWRFPAPAIKK
ncbi:5-formyltetrahydrofolate cyclo-ligase [Candidatus Steffania adelgidicola]|uniref:5-formyltetrahydrofolate cyclo-ligase n=1 Tax=Candidatus Steffania adelgidicola TaxID=1076626 RepID=UPI001D00E1BD|nr:5-formyltetrahydrofolate cyclo-ligase [Candidatus Steffania adelgidicola]UDG79686.1 5-formyltetrahydrofolate cyclo-ligase [Candidatus Steffania adelgidicola]